MLEQFEQIGRDALAELKKVADLTVLEEFRIKYLGRKGQVIQMLSQIGKLPSEQKRQAGQLANRIKNDLTKAFEIVKKHPTDFPKEEMDTLLQECMQDIAQFSDLKEILEFFKFTRKQMRNRMSFSHV